MWQIMKSLLAAGVFSALRTLQVLSNDIPIIEIVAFIVKPYKSANSLADTLNGPEFSRLQYGLKGIVVPFL